jgi:hypothetical protein
VVEGVGETSRLTEDAGAKGEKNDEFEDVRI